MMSLCLSAARIGLVIRVGFVAGVARVGGAHGLTVASRQIA
jgi:hypothetical protein